MNKNKIHRFTAQIHAARGGAFVYIPFDVEKEFGKKRVKVEATFDGEPYRGLLVRYGSPDFMLIIRKNIREKLGKQAGDMVEVTLKEDTAPRVIIVPDDFQMFLDQEPGVLTFYKSLSYTQQKEYIHWIEAAKRSETRERRMKKAMELLRLGKKSR